MNAEWWQLMILCILFGSLFFFAHSAVAAASTRAEKMVVGILVVVEPLSVCGA